MFITADGRPVVMPVHDTPPPPPPPPPKAHDVSTAKEALQKQLGKSAPNNEAALAAAVKKIQQENAAITEAALARAAILLQEQYDASHHQPQNKNVDPVKEAASQIGLTHRFDESTLDAATKSLSGSALQTAPANPPSGAHPVSVGDARNAIQTGLNNGLTWQEAVNAARVQFGGATQNETALDEAALAIKGDQLANGSDAKSGNVLSDASQQLAGLHLFGGASNKAALAALTVKLKPSSALAADAKSADSAWATLQRDQAKHASAATIDADLAAYHNDLDTELGDAANLPAGSSTTSLDDPSQSDLRWQAQQAVIAANTATGLHGAPSTSALLTSLRASQIVQTAASPSGTGAQANQKAAQALTQALQGVPANSVLYDEVMGDARVTSLQAAALADVTGAHGNNAQDTLVAEGNALSGYRNTVLYPQLVKDTLASRTTQQNLQAVGTPGKLTDIANLLDPVAKASPELAQALFSKLQGKIESLVGQGAPYDAGTMETPQQMDSYYGPVSRIVNDAGGPQSASAKPVVDALRTQLLKQQSLLDREKNALGSSPDSNVFQSLAYMRFPQNNDPTDVYQYLINEGPQSKLAGDLAKTLEEYTGLKAQPAPIKPAKNAAGTLASAEDALNDQLNTGPVNASTLQKALAAARKADPSISQQTWAEAVIARQAQSDAAANATSKKKAPSDLVATASGEVTNDQLFDADTMSSATGALQSGKIADGGLVPKKSMSLEPGQPNAAQYMQSLVSGGMTVPEAVALTRAWLSGAPDSDLVLTQAALTVTGQQYLPTYYSEPNGTDPIDYAAQQLKKMGVIDPATIDLAVNGRPASEGQPAVTGMKQNVKPNLAALAGKNGKPGLIDKVNSAYATWQTAQAKANKAGSTAKQKTAAQNALQAYHTALSSALNAAAGRAPNDSGWQSDPAYIDTMWKSQNELELAALAPQIEAAQSAGQHSPQATALENAFQQWQTGLDALQIVGQVQNAQQTASDPDDPASGDVAAAQALTNETYGLEEADPQLYQQVMGDATVTNLQQSVLASITSAAAVPNACTIDGNDSAAPGARLHEEGTRLQAYEGTSLYAQLVDSVAKDPTTQQLFSSITTSVNGQKSDADKLKTLADTIEGTSPDLAALLVNRMFQTGGKHSTFTPSQLVSWTKGANDMTQISRIYVAAGGAQNADMTTLRKSLETMVTGDRNFGQVSYDSRLNTQIMAAGETAVVYGESLGFDSLKKNGVQMQLAQDMLDDAPKSALGTEIARETGFKSLGAPAAPVSTTGKGATTLGNDASFDPSSGLVVTQAHHLAGLQWQDGMQTVTSYDQLLNTIGEDNGLKADYAPASLGDEQKLSYGQFLLYNPNDTVFDSNGKKTTLGQVAQSLSKGEGIVEPNSLAPVTLAALSGEWWNTRTPSQGQQGKSFTLLEGIDSNGGLIDVGPANTTVRHGYTDWQSNTGFDKGYMLAQPHWVTSASGVVQTGSAYFVDYKPYNHWYDWDNLKGDLEMAAMVVGGIAAMIALPESAPLWMVLLSEAADAGFALSAAVGTVNSLRTIVSTPGGARNVMNWLQLAANVFGGAASGLGALARAGTALDRLAAAEPAFQDAARLATTTRDASALDFARDEVQATLNGGRLVRTFDDTWLSRVLASRLVGTDPAGILRTLDTTQALRALQETRAFGVLGATAMVTNGASMLGQFYMLAKAGRQASTQDWLNLFLSAGLMMSGVGVERMRAGDPTVNAARVTAINEQLPEGVRLLDSGDIEISPKAFAHLDLSDAKLVSQLTRSDAVTQVISRVMALREAGVFGQGRGQAGTSDTDEAFSTADVKVLNDLLPSGLKVTSAGTLSVATGERLAPTTALDMVLRVLNKQAQDGDEENTVDHEAPVSNETPSSIELQPTVYGDDASNVAGSAGDMPSEPTLLARLAAEAGLPPAGQDYEDGAFRAPLTALVSDEFAATPAAEALFGAGMDGDVPSSPSQQWIADEVAPRLADAIVQAGTAAVALPGLRLNNIDVIVGPDGRAADVIVNNWALGPSPRNLAFSDPEAATGNAQLQPLQPPDLHTGVVDGATSYEAYADGGRQAWGNRQPLFTAIADSLVKQAQAMIPDEWLNDPAHQDAILAATNRSVLSPAFRMMAARELLLTYWKDHPEAVPTNAGGADETGTPGGAAQARISRMTSPEEADRRTQAADEDSLSLPAPGVMSNGMPNGAATRDAGSNGQRAGGRQQASEEAGGSHAQPGAKVTRPMPDQQQSRRSRDGNAQQQQQPEEEETRHTPAQAKAAMPAKSTEAAEAAAGNNARTDAPGTTDVPQTPAVNGPIEADNAASTAQASPERGAKAGLTITRYDVKNAIRVIKARFGDLILPSRMPDENQIALLGDKDFAQARRQAEKEGRGSFDENVLGFAVTDGTMNVGGKEVRAVLPMSIAPENVPASSVLMHDMLHLLQSPDFVEWAEELSARLNADEQVRASGWLNIDVHEGMTELFNVRMFGGAGAPGEENTSFAQHVYQSVAQGYKAILYALDGAVNEVIVDRVGDDTALRTFGPHTQAERDAYEAAAFEVYRNPPPELLALRNFVRDKVSEARSGDGEDNTNAAYGVRGPAPGAHAPDEPARTPAGNASAAHASAAETSAKEETSKLMARLFKNRATTRAEQKAELAFARIDRIIGGDDGGGGSAGAMARKTLRVARQLSRMAESRMPKLGGNRPEGGETTPRAGMTALEPPNAGTDIDNLLASFDKRGLSEFFVLDGVGRAAEALRDKSKIVLVTGFSVDVDETGKPLAETDGPPGTAYLARVLERLGEARAKKGGKPLEVTIVTDTANQRVMRAALDALGATGVKVELFDTPYGPAPTDGAPYDSGARPSAGQLLDRLAPDAVVAIELPAHTRVSGPINMRGKSVAGFNSARDALVEVANGRGITTVGVGDGGNEAGVVQKRFAKWATQKIPMVELPGGEKLEFRSAVPADHAVTAWNSSFGAQAIGVAMAALDGRLDLVPHGDAYEASIEATARAGAIDGVSRVRAASVDGISAPSHGAYTNALIDAARDPHGVYLPEQPVVVVVFDSSNGALVAHQELEAEISRKTGRAVQFVYVVDHGNAPYGNYAERLDLLADLVRNALQTGDEIPSAELIVMACNTAHGPHYVGRMNLDEMGRPVINLIETTASMMHDEGGEHPALFATKATVDTHMYRDRLEDLSERQRTVQEVAAPDWASIVNEMEHASTDRAVRARVQENVNAIVANLNDDTTSVWLCCTHYPALERQIRTALDARGMNDVPIFNPMTEQGDVARAAIGWEPLPDGVAPLVRNPPPLVLTTGDAETVQADARELTGYANARAIHFDSFGTDADMSAVHGALARPKLKPISRLLATQWASGGELHHASQTHIFVPNGAESAADAFEPASGPTMILVGAEAGAADGVVGASVLGSGLAQAGPDNVYVVPDTQTAQSVRAAHAAAGAGKAKVEIFQPGDDAQTAAADLLEKVGPASVVAVKVYGRNADGAYHTTGGVRIDAVPLDEILIQANERDLATVGIGDAPVYAGLHTAEQSDGPWYEVLPTAASGDRPMVNPGSVVTSKFPVTGPTATAASDGLLGALQAAEKVGDVLLTPDQFGAVISVGRDRERVTNNRTTETRDQHLNTRGQRGPMTEALHELLLSLLDRNEPPEEVPLDPTPGPDAPQGEAEGPARDDDSATDPSAVSAPADHIADRSPAQPAKDPAKDPAADSSALKRATDRVTDPSTRQFAKDLLTDRATREQARDQVASASKRQARRIASRMGEVVRKTGSNASAPRNAGTDIDNLLASFDKRGLSRFFVLDGVGRAAEALRDKSKIVLVTGFSVDVDEAGKPLAETDGPPGTAYLARVLERLGEARAKKGGKPMEVTIVTDTANRRVMRAALDALGATGVKVELFDTPYGPAPTDGAPYDSGARPSAGQLLDRLAPDAVVAIELPAHTRVSGPINMRGKSVAGFNSARDALVEVANGRGITTVGVGDGGNEAGVVQKRFAKWATQRIPMVRLPGGEELEFRSAVPADHAVTAWNSSFGAQAIGVAMAALDGRLDLAPHGDAYEASIEATARAGAIDGVSRVRASSVDGISAPSHGAYTNALIDAARDPHGVYLPDRPLTVIVYDSSDGALVAHQELEEEISRKTGRAVQFVYVLDHGHAPYGQKSPEMLRDLVRQALQTGDEIPSADILVMACNTAHSPHYSGRMSIDDDSKLPALDLIKTTSKMMLDEGGEHPMVLATQATVDSGMYAGALRELSQGQIDVQEVAAPEWANFVNHPESYSPEEVQENVDAIVANLNDDTTSVWLCCTHYPALERQIRSALDARGMSHVRIVNPMQEHAATARTRIGWAPLPDGAPTLVRNPPPLVLTTGDADEVLASAQRWTGYADARVIHFRNFGSDADMSAVHEALGRLELKPISCLLAAQWAGGGERHYGSQTHIFVPNGAETAADAFEPASGPTMILVGAEAGAADGVVGASVLGSGLAQAGPDNVYVVPDTQTAQSVRAAHAAAGGGNAKIEIFRPGDDAQTAAADLLEKVGPASVVAVKVYGRNADGAYHTTGGVRIDAVPLDEILIQANERDLATVGIGDAPVYAGWHTAEKDGPWYEVRPAAARGDRPMVNPGSVVTSKFPVTGPTATMASDGLLGALQAAEKVGDVLLTPDRFGAVISVGRDRERVTNNRTTEARDQHLNTRGQRGPMTEALHELLLSLLDRNEPPEEVPLDPAPGPQTPQRESGGPAGKVAYARVSHIPQGDDDNGNGGADEAASAAGDLEFAVPANQWDALLARLNQGDLRESDDVYAYLVQPKPNAPDAPGGITGKLIGWGVFGQGSKKGRWLGQGSLNGPSTAIDRSRLNPNKIPSDHYVVISRRPLDDEAFSGRFPAAQLTDDPSAIAWPELPVTAPDSTVAPAVEASGTSVAPSATADTSSTPATVAAPVTTTPAGTGKSMKWTRFGATLGTAAGVSAATIDAAGHLALPAATASLCFIYRGSMVALRTRLGTLISRHLSGLSEADSESHLDWLDRMLVQRGAAWGINRSTRRQYAAAISTLRATTRSGDPDDLANIGKALDILEKAPAQLYMPRTVLGNVNDVMQSATLAANVAINGTYVLENGASEGVAGLLTNAGFGLSNSVLSTKTLAARIAAPLRAAKLGATMRMQDIAQTIVMTGYSMSTIPWAWSDFDTSTTVGIVKGGLDVVFGMGASGQAFNDAHKLLTGDAGRFRIGRVHPLMFLGIGAVARFTLQLFTLPQTPAPVAQVPGNGQQSGKHRPQPGSTQHTSAPVPSPSTSTASPNGHAGSKPGGQSGGKPGNQPGSKPGSNPGTGSHGNGGSNPSPGHTGGSKPAEVEVEHGQSLWQIADDELDQILSASSRERVEPQTQNAETATALQQLLQLNPKFDADPDRIFAGQTIVLNNGSPK